MYYLDMIWHKPDRTTITKQEFDAKLSEIIKQEEWIIDGNYGRTLEMRFKECDTVFFLDLPTNVCLAGAEGRIGRYAMAGRRTVSRIQKFYYQFFKG